MSHSEPASGKMKGLSDMNKREETLQAMLIEVVENQLRDGNPAVTAETFARLKAEGHSEKEVKLLIAAVLLLEMNDMVKENRPFNEVQFAADMRQLPELRLD
jgi:hypothetical protein